MAGSRLHLSYPSTANSGEPSIFPHLPLHQGHGCEISPDSCEVIRSPSVANLSPGNISWHRRMISWHRKMFFPRREFAYPRREMFFPRAFGANPREAERAAADGRYSPDCLSIELHFQRLPPQPSQANRRGLPRAGCVIATALAGLNPSQRSSRGGNRTSRTSRRPCCSWRASWGRPSRASAARPRSWPRSRAG